ncbi:putative formate dehydrogenase formation protein [Magnetospirillum sp. XM-1]|uniref:formate dehydrogenase accessory sulfurtransferase FdhD n=1 Tax=Magnetospirillum sp. XM-1 TaxID=1663591 RepID=UPI00073DFB80|nr:formate dehydrogenase accessory sulfurtransferase FdhD [Magnetospirillum sp. XM-1]CUW39806.1 putative formate dehydrogenase formation protein [Magnetospirillum sp. XM-1]
MSKRVDGTSPVAAVRLDRYVVDEELCSVITEDTLTISVEGVGTYTLMWTPTGGGACAMAYTPADGILGEAGVAEPLAMAVGFLFTEGIIETVADLRAVAFCPDDSKVVTAYLADTARPQARRRDVVMNSSCGVCGEGGRIEEVISGLPQAADGLVVDAATLHRLMAEMGTGQTVFAATGGAHAAAVFDASGRIVAIAEDLGRHNALDKVIGRCLLDGVDTSSCGVLLSSRLSLEMVTKAARARFQLVAAVSAPTSLAVEVAERRNITLCGFLRGDRCTVYSHRRRIGELGSWVN